MRSAVALVLAAALTACGARRARAASYADCLAEAVPRDAQRETLVATLAGRDDDPAVTQLADARVSRAGRQD